VWWIYPTLIIKTAIFYNFEVLFFEQTEHFKEAGCLKFCSLCKNEYYIAILGVKGRHGLRGYTDAEM
jgi:hypothetical protein